jgi:RNA polymerase sigma-70 factor (ECF subfamily)
VWTHVTVDLAAFYLSAYPRVVATVTMLTGNRSEAEELVQDAVVAMIPRWERSSEYDDPEAWLRRVAMRKAVSRWRRTKSASAALVRHGAPLDGVEADVTGMDLTRALGRLPIIHRQVLVLHYVLDYSIDQIASELDLAPGTVKSRLSRGRDALAPYLRGVVL